MLKTLDRAVKYGETLEVMYMAKDGSISKRRIRVLQVGETSFRAYCYLRKSKRTFIIDNVLAAVPIQHKESLVIWLRMIPEEAIPHYENMIYLPMIMTILSRDRERFEKLSLKFNGPYINFIDEVMATVQIDLKQTHDYLRKNKMKLIKGKKEGIFVEYIFLHSGYEDRRNYLNVRLHNRTEELMNEYFSKVNN